MGNLYLQLLFRQKGMLLIGISLALLTAFSGIALLAYSGWFISAAAIAGASLVSAHAFNFFTPGAIVRGLSISRTAGRYGERLANHEVTFRLITELRTRLFSTLSSQHNISSLMNRHDSASRLLQDIQNIEGIYLQAAIPAVTALLTAAGYLLVVSLVLPSLAVWATPLLLLMLFGLPYLYARAVVAPESSLHQQRNRLWSQCSALFSSLRLLALAQRLSAEGERLREGTHQCDLNELQSLQRQQAVGLLSQLISLLLVGLSLALGLQAYVNEALPGALIFMLLLLALGSSEVLNGANMAIAQLMLGQAALTRLYQLAEFTPAQPAQNQHLEISDRPAGVRIEHLSFSYAEQPVLSGLNLDLQGPGLVWLTGPSGQGKTTVLRLLGGQLVQTRGEIIFNRIAADQIGYLPQRVQVLRDSLRRNLCLQHPHSDAEIIAALQQVCLDEWLTKLPDGLDTWIGESEWQPSGGELKRIGLARLILQQPQLILLDEPFAGMDLALQAEILANLRVCWADRLVLLVSHDLSGLAATDQTIRL